MWVAGFVTLLTVQHLSARVTRGDGLRLSGRPLRYYLDGWSQFDGPEYIKIATQGYSYVPGERSNIVWFPLYPLLLRAANRVVSDPLIAGVVVSAIAGLAAAILLWAWTRSVRLSGNAQIWAICACLLYPYGWYLYGVVHADSLFLALAVASFFLVERAYAGGHRVPLLVLAGVVGAMATATRPTGMALVIGLAALVAERAGVVTALDRPAEGQPGGGQPAGGQSARVWPARVWRAYVPRLTVAVSRFEPEQLLVLIAALGVGAYSWYLWRNWGDPIAFVTNERVYHPGDLPWLKRQFLVRWRDMTDVTYTLTITLQAVLAVSVLALTPRIRRQFGFGYAVYCIALVAIPTLSTEDFMGTGRYLIAAFPAWASVGTWVAERPRRRGAVLWCSAALMVAMAAAFSRSWYLT
jgi:hypothetical protein